MKIKLDPGAVMPTRAHPYDAGLDLYMPNGIEPVYVPPFGDSVAIVTDGTIDCGYTGSIRVTLFNHGATAYMVNPGDKIAQLVIVPCCLPPLEEVDVLEATDRGTNGFGSTGQ